MATTYSRGSYTTTTIGKAAFDGRVRNGIGSGHCFMVTKKCLKNLRSLKTTHSTERTRRAEIRPLPVTGKASDQAARPISISPLNALPRLHA
jgi:hypothetical protein